MAKRWQDGMRIENTSQMIDEAAKRDFIYVDVEIVRDYLLNHLFDEKDVGRLSFDSTNVPGVLMVRYKSNDLPF